jgi:hypothetical protein
MEVVECDGFTLVRNVSAGKVHFIKECGGVWDSTLNAWQLPVLPFPMWEFKTRYKTAKLVYEKAQPEKRIRRKKTHVLFETERHAYYSRVNQMTQDKERWLSGDVPFDETSNTQNSTPFSERGDRDIGVLVCFCGMRPAIEKGLLQSNGRYGYIIGRYTVVLDRISSIRRRVGSLLCVSPVRILQSPPNYPWSEPRGICVFDVQLYGDE